MPINKFSPAVTQTAPPLPLFTACPSRILKKSPVPCLERSDSWLAPCSRCLDRSFLSSCWEWCLELFWDGGKQRVGWWPRSKGSLCPQKQGDSGGIHPSTCPGVGKGSQPVWVSLQNWDLSLALRGFPVFNTKKTCVVDPQTRFSLSKIGGKHVVVWDCLGFSADSVKRLDIELET